MTLGKQFVEVANGNKTILAEVEDKIRNHKEVVLLTFCLNAAKKGALEANMGKCLPPPCLDEEGIFFKKNANSTMIAYWK